MRKRRHRLGMLLTEMVQGEANGGEPCTLEQIMKAPVVFSTKNGEVDLLSFYYWNGKVYVDIGEER